MSNPHRSHTGLPSLRDLLGAPSTEEEGEAPVVVDVSTPEATAPSPAAPTRPDVGDAGPSAPPIWEALPDPGDDSRDALEPNWYRVLAAQSRMQGSEDNAQAADNRGDRDGGDPEYPSR
jgi:hypothetical protein